MVIKKRDIPSFVGPDTTVAPKGGERVVGFREKYFSPTSMSNRDWNRSANARKRKADD
jgi:hypothetical protein